MLFAFLNRGAFLGRLSLGILVTIGAIALAGPARAQSPEQRADTYLENELDPDIVAAIFDLPKPERAEAIKKLKPWHEELRTVPIRLTQTPTTASVGHYGGHGHPPTRRSGFSSVAP